MFTVKIIGTAELSEAERSEIIQVCIDAHDQEDFKNLFSYIPSGGRHFLGCLDDKVVSHALVTTRWLQPENMSLLKTAYVDAVSTSPTVQGQGYGSGVMRSVTANIPDYEIACLETEKEGFYSRLGWEAWRGKLAGRSDHGLIPTPEQTGIMIFRLPNTPTLNLDSLLTIEVSGRIW